MHTRYFQVGGVFEDIPLGFEREAARLLRGDADPGRPVRGAARPQRDLPAADPGASAIVSRERLLELGVTGPLLRAAGEPWDLRKAAPVPRLRRRRLQDPGRHGRRRLRPLPGADAGDARVGADHRAVPRRAARGAVDRRRPQGRAAAARRALDLDGGADPPLQARHRGLPGPAGRGLLPDRVAARRARLLRARRRLGEAGPGPLPRPLVRRTCSRCGTCASAATSPT